MGVPRLPVLMLCVCLVTPHAVEGQALLPPSGYVRGSPAPSDNTRHVLMSQVATSARAEAQRQVSLPEIAPGGQALLEKKDDPAYPAYAALYEQVRQIPAFLTKIANELDSLDHIEKARRQLRDRAVDVRLGAALLEAVIPLVEASGERASIQKLQDSAMARADALDDMANQLPPSPIPRGFFPVRTTEQAQCFWAREEGGYLTGALITAKDDRGAIGVSVLEDYLWPVRFAFTPATKFSLSRI